MSIKWEEDYQFKDLISSLDLVSRINYTEILSNVPEDEGIYGISLNNPKRIYVGRTGSSPFSAGLKRRIRTHINNLINNKHSNKYLQADFNVFGYQNFSFLILDREDSEEKEQKFINYFKKKGFFTYNDYREDQKLKKKENNNGLGNP